MGYRRVHRQIQKKENLGEVGKNEALSDPADPLYIPLEKR